MSVVDPVIDYIDGPNRRIYLLQGVSEFHWIEDIYREYIELRSIDEDLRKFLPFLRQAGNDPKGGGKYTPRYVTLLAGTRVVPYDENILITVTGEAITDNADVDPDPFDTTTRTQPLKLYITPPASELVKAADELIAIQRMAFDEVITVNVESGSSGTEWPIGTLGQPVNNLADGLTISAVNDIYTFSVLVDTIIDSGADYRGMTFIGASKTKTRIDVSEAAQVNNCEFYDAHVTGTLDGDSTLHSCVIDNLNYVTGFIEQCVLDAGTIMLGAGATAHFLDCWSGVPGVSTPTIDMGGAGQALAMRNYNGGILIQNKTGTESVSVDLNSGQVKLDLETVTNGTVVIRGIGKVVEMTTGENLSTGYYGSLYLLNEAINRDNISAAVWDEPVADHLLSGTAGRTIGIQQFGSRVTLDVVNGSSGTTFPIGTERVPVNNIPDAVAIAVANGIKAFHIIGNITAVGGPFAGYIVYGDNTQDTIITCTDLDCQGVTFENCTVTGTFVNDSYITTKECVVRDVTDVEITAHATSFGGAIKLLNSVGNKSVFYDCYDDVPGIGIPDIQVSGCNALGIWNWNGGIRLSTIDTPDTVISCMIAQGRLWVDETCVEGDIIVKGMADLRGETGGTTIDSEGLITGNSISDVVWNSLIEEGFSAGDILRISSAVLAGQVSGAGSSVETFKGLDGVTDRVVSTVDEDGNRTQVDIDVS